MLDKDLLERLRSLRQFQGSEGQFWVMLAELTVRLYSAEWNVMYRQQNGLWQPFCFWPLGRQAAAASLSQEQLSLMSEQAALEPVVYASCGGDDAGLQSPLLCLRLMAGEPVLAVLGRNHPPTDQERPLDLMKSELLLEIPERYRHNLEMSKARLQAAKAYEPLDLLLSLNEQQRFKGLAMALCNELTARLNCTRVSLGWVQDNYVHVQAISHMEKFERKMDVVQSLESVMEECFDQDEELAVPGPHDSTVLTAEHEDFSSRYGLPAMLSLPLRLDRKAVAVLTCERQNPFTTDEIHDLRIVCDQVVRRLGDLKDFDHLFESRIVRPLREWFGKFLGPEHTLIKVSGVAVVLLLAILVFGRMEYRVDAPFILRTEDLSYLSVPFDGFIDKVARKPGDFVRKGDLLLRLDTRELRLEESRAVADYDRYLREEEKAMSESKLAEMRVSAAQKEQAEARLDMVRFKLSYAEMRAPFDGVVVEGDLDKLIGAPVHKGDVLLKVAKLKDLYVEMKVSESEIHQFMLKQKGQIAFVGQPGRKIDVVVERIEPMAVTEKEGNVFLVICRIEGKPDLWLRPGMSGLAKVAVGQRQIIWILLHKTIDFIRMNLWW
ncbi:MAG: HlyD family efflux transporter periplasmic adaptor subunit [Chlorobiaceae bacterium]|nr:HlyD family efflux transporter periplasmic adaptor subunit [Chlorobiaceae bacterium]